MIAKAGPSAHALGPMAALVTAAVLTSGAVSRAGHQRVIFGRSRVAGISWLCVIPLPCACWPARVVHPDIVNHEKSIDKSLLNACEGPSVRGSEPSFKFSVKGCCTHSSVTADVRVSRWIPAASGLETVLPCQISTRYSSVPGTPGGARAIRQSPPPSLRCYMHHWSDKGWSDSSRSAGPLRLHIR
ncbi:hypothetical protein PF005_g28084 [Phytophthora fragariae]|uniref:Uncharacterized protein n=1 Tax=Phytophthora fragariae TaxID=53985 RepID=A0A6A3QZ88_9STRA|nr:hypothetical protein PF003_g18597 [Phytophthora fragariae]KAE8940008.1 hypothetical protein PF009_g10160 [Phytophthora fragariae]KAE8970699.1 hypothetical protein PF011_g26322 [Phytophthora fragariae]KAE9069400.1 hypothetical protein PF007_g27335 [Phytophthora fragariae]KAE9085550.1 hypothetical protein PF006_g26231 [Phytophthora fragariae]